VTALITRYGALGVFLLMVPESACIPVPSEVTLLFSGFAVSQHWMSFFVAVLAATAGNVLGSLIAYAAGAGATRVPWARGVLSRSEGLLGERPMRAVFTARLLPLARTFVSLPAGARRLPLGRFTVLTAAGCAIWAAAFVAIGLVAGAAWQVVNGVVGKALLGIGVLVLVVLAVRRDPRRRARASRGHERQARATGRGVVPCRVAALGSRQQRGRSAEVGDEQTPQTHPSRGAEGAAVRWEETHSDDEAVHPPPSEVPEIGHPVPNHHSASAEAAALRWEEQHDEE
jgi:membrane protein DedA with SNARE-associated domain